jgi:hypothetical protein
VKNKQYMFRNLVNIFYDLSVLKRVTNEVKSEVLSKFQEEI